MPASFNHCCLASALLSFKFCTAVFLYQGLTLQQRKQLQATSYRTLKTILMNWNFQKEDEELTTEWRALAGLPPWDPALKRMAVHSKTNFAFLVLTIFTKLEHFVFFWYYLFFSTFSTFSFFKIWWHYIIIKTIEWFYVIL